jgi:succinoglycan biosynthesis transport protein ExoP
MSERAVLTHMFPPEPMPAGVLTIKRIFRVWRRHLRLFLTCFAGIILVGAAVILLLKPSYTATAVVMIGPQNADPAAPIGQQTADTIDDDVSATDASRMQSRDVAAAVLAQIPPLPAPAGFNIGEILCRIGVTPLCANAGPVDPVAVQQAEIDKFLKTVVIVPELHSHAIDVSVTAPTGPRAALLADAVVTAFQQRDLTQQTDDINRVAAWLDTRTSELQQHWLDAVNTANAFSVAHGLTNANDGATTTPLIDTQITNTATSLAAAQAQLAQAQAQSDALHAASLAGHASGLVDMANQPVLAAAANSLLQLQQSRGQLAGEFGPDYPKIKALDRQIAETEATLNSQTASALGSINDTLISAQANARQLTKNLDQLKTQAAGQSAEEAQYLSLTDEALSAKNVYETFLEHENDVVDRAALLEPPVILVSHAGVPLHPTFPNRPKLAIGIFALALATGLAAIFIRDHLSIGFDEIDGISTSTQLPVLAMLPHLSAKLGGPIERHVLDDPFSSASEAVRGLAAKLALLAGDTTRPRAVLVASAGAAEGKSTLAVWLAITARQGGQAVLLIDGDHRRGTLMGETAGSAKPGLTDLISGQAKPADVIKTDPATKIDFIPSGMTMSRPFGPEEISRLRLLIESLKKSYSLIVIDSPPLLAMTDGLVLGNVADQTVFVVRWQETSRKAVSASLERLRAYGAKVPGIVLTMLDENPSLAYDGSYSRREMQLLSRPYGT